MRLQYVIRVEQQTAAEAAAQARAEAAAQARAEAMEAAAQAREAAAEARAQAQEDAQRAREDAHRIRDEIRERIREQMRGPEPEVFVAQRPPSMPWEHAIPPQVVDIITMVLVALVICVVGFPIARAFGRWIDRRGLPSPVNAELAAQMNRIEQAVDSMSVEVERISEAQRYQAKLLTDRENARA